MILLEARLQEFSLENPDKPAVITAAETVSYRELWEMGGKAAGFLKKTASEENPTVVIRAEHTAHYIALAIGCHLSGCVFVPVEDKLPEEKLTSICQSVEAKMIVGYVLPGYNCMSMDAFWSSVQSVEPLYEFPDEEKLADILFTTGTTGDSKGVMISYKSIAAVSQNITNAIGLNETSKYLIPMPVNHAFGIRRTYATLYAGGTVVYCNGVFPPATIFSLLEKTGAEHLMLVPSALALFLKIGASYLAKYKDQIVSLEVSAAPLSPSVRKEFMELMPNTHLWNTYGATEFPGACSYDFLEDGELSDCIGRPTVNSIIEILDENGNVMPDSSRDNPGLVAVRGPMNMMGYWKNPDASLEVMKDGRVMSKDLGFRGTDGRYYVIGRADDVINIGGFKISPVEIEDVLQKYPGLKDCACVAKDDEIAGKLLVLYVVPENPETWNLYDFSDYMRQHLEAKELPEQIISIDEIPRTYNGKIRRNVLRNLKGENNE